MARPRTRDSSSLFLGYRITHNRPDLQIHICFSGYLFGMFTELSNEILVDQSLLITIFLAYLDSHISSMNGLNGFIKEMIQIQMHVDPVSMYQCKVYIVVRTKGTYPLSIDKTKCAASQSCLGCALK